MLQQSAAVDGSLFVQAVLNVGGSISAEYLRLVSLAGALGDFNLFGSSLLRGRAVLWSDLIGVDQLLSKADVERGR